MSVGSLGDGDHFSRLIEGESCQAGLCCCLVLCYTHLFLTDSVVAVVGVFVAGQRFLWVYFSYTVYSELGDVLSGLGIACLVFAVMIHVCVGICSTVHSICL